jgi:hypothetical protein
MADRNMYISNRSKKLKPLSITLTKNQGSKTLLKEEPKPVQNEEVKKPEPEPANEEAKQPQDEEIEEGQ